MLPFDRIIDVNMSCFLILSFILYAGVQPFQSVEGLKEFTLTLSGQIRNPTGMPAITFTTLMFIEGLKLNMTIDTTFNAFFIPDSIPKYVNNQKLHHKFGINTKKFHLLEANSTLDYGPSILEGGLFRGHISNAHISYEIFVANNSDVSWIDAAWDGVIGLGPRISSSGAFISGLKKKNLIEKGQIGLWFSPSWKPLSERKFKITFGSLIGPEIDRNVWNETSMQSFKKKPNPFANDHWFVGLDSYSFSTVGKIVATHGDDIMIISSNAQYLEAPKKYLEELYPMLRLGQYNSTRKDHFRCDDVEKNLILKFKMEGVERELTSKYYILEAESNPGHCYLGIIEQQPGTKKNEWVLGTNFLSSFYTAIDIDQGLIYMTK